MDGCGLAIILSCEESNSIEPILVEDLCGVCDPCGDGTKYEACANWNSTCEGCTNPYAACNSFDSTATVYEEGSCISPSYICETGDDGLLDITTILLK